MNTLEGDWYGQCWTYNNDTDGMWRIYSPQKDGIKLKTTVRKLFDSFYDSGAQFASLQYFIGAVLYLTEAEIVDFMSKVSFQDIQSGGKADGFAELLCVKREAFKHENEIRLLFQDVAPRRGVAGVAEFALDVNKVCDEVVLDPRLTDAEATALEGKIKAAGCALPISRSSLYRVPKFTIPL
jgi:hypothetical protein